MSALSPVMSVSQTNVLTISRSRVGPSPYLNADLAISMGYVTVYSVYRVPLRDDRNYLPTFGDISETPKWPFAVTQALLTLVTPSAHVTHSLSCSLF